MDHKMAETSYLVEKYMSDEMSDVERTEFEEHMFDCPVCSDRVRQDFTLIENLKALPMHELRVAAPARAGGWREWLRIPSLVPTFAALALACVMGYQHIGGTGSEETARVLPQLAVLQPATRSADVVTIQVDRKSKVFELGVNADRLPAGSFICELQNAAGKTIAKLPGGQQNMAIDLHVQLLTKDFPAGRYQLVLRPAAEPDSIVTYPFAVENNQ
jgi:Putative zinc-finger